MSEGEAKVIDGFGKWMEEPDIAGIYHFKGRRFTTRGGFVYTNDLVEVRPVKVGLKNTFEVLFFGRYRGYIVADFRGKWRKLIMDFQGERKR